MKELKVAVIGLDTSHSIELPRMMNAPDCPQQYKIAGLKVVACNRFMTHFTTKEVLDKRQLQLEQWGIKVTESFDETIADCDAIMLEINEPALHLQYFEQVANLGKPVFLDKPLCESLDDARKIMALARKYGTRVWSGSSIPLNPKVNECVFKLQHEPLSAYAFGPMGKAPAGNSLIWYGVHTFEVMQRLIGAMGAKSVSATKVPGGIISTVTYNDDRIGIASCLDTTWCYGGHVQNNNYASMLHIPADEPNYFHLMYANRKFFRGEEPPVKMEKTFEGLAIMNAAVKSAESGKSVEVESL